jgi:hypothetical protein
VVEAAEIVREYTDDGSNGTGRRWDSISEPAEPKRVPAKEVNREKHFHFEVRHFREKLREARHPLRLHMGEQGVAGKSALPHYY